MEGTGRDTIAGNGNEDGAALMRLIEQGKAVGPQLYSLLRERIVRGDLVPGMRLSETDIAGAYNVSRQPVREAFIKLAEEALLDVRPQRGTYVSLISPAAVMTARFIREAVEADIVRSVAETIDAAQIAALDGQIAAQRALDADAPGEVFMLMDEKFHRTLAELAGQAAVADYLEGLKTQMNRVRHISARQFAHDKLVAQHAGIVDGIRARDPDAAEAAMRAHLREIMADLPSIVEAHPDFFPENGAPRAAPRKASGGGRHEETETI